MASVSNALIVVVGIADLWAALADQRHRPIDRSCSSLDGARVPVDFADVGSAQDDCQRPIEIVAGVTEAAKDPDRYVEVSTGSSRTVRSALP